jgi:universal stress protein E
LAAIETAQSMRSILIIADRRDRRPHAVARGLSLARQAGAQVLVVGFLYEYLGSLPLEMAPAERDRLRERLIRDHRSWLSEVVHAASPGNLQVQQEVVWEKDVAGWVIEHVRNRGCTLVIKTGHRSEAWNYTPTDWRLIRGCPVPVLLVAQQRWRGERHVMALVDLGTRVAAKREVNHRVVAAAAELAGILGRKLHLAYAPPFSEVLRDLDVVDPVALTAAGRQRAEVFLRRLARANLHPAAVHVRAGPPHKVLASIAAHQKIEVTVLGTVGRKGLVGKLIGNTAEHILPLLKTDVLVVK